jgi:hypothetical protein
MSRDREDNREYMRQYRADKRGVDGATVTQLRPTGDSVVDAVRSEIELLPLAEKRPADVAAALAMARILDDPASIPQQAAAAARLLTLMTGLRSEVDGGTSKLATLRSIRGTAG